MKKIIRYFLGPLFIAILFGFVCGKVIYKIYEDDIENSLKSSKLYLVRNGEYLTYEEMREENSNNNYVYYKDDKGYKSVVGITKNIDNVDKIKKLYSDNMIIDEYYLSYEISPLEMDEYDKELTNSSDMYEVKEIVNNILDLYKNDDSIKLVLVK